MHNRQTLFIKDNALTVEDLRLSPHETFTFANVLVLFNEWLDRLLGDTCGLCLQVCSPRHADSSESCPP